jgi:cytochrome b pre-mRNA-processing protein 3
MIRNPFRTPPEIRLAPTLYARAVDQARDAAFYQVLGVDDRIDARFELYTLHVLLLVMRLRDEGERGAEASQALFNVYVSALDDALRELGVGDLSVSKKMRKLGEALYGRMKTYETALRAGDETALSEGLARNVFESDDPETGRALMRYVVDSRIRLAAQPYKALSDGPDWAEVMA